MNTIQEQILFGYAVREAAYEAGLLTEKPSSLKEGTQGFADAWIEEFKRQNKKNNMEQIKVGDIVRVSEDVPEIYIGLGFGLESIPKMEVKEVQDGCARICSLTSNDFVLAFEYIIPTKYLVKVNAEPKYSKGDKVSYCGELYVVTNITVVGRERDIHYTIERDYDKSITSVAERFLNPYTEPKEPTIKVGDRVRSKGYGND